MPARSGRGAGQPQNNSDQGRRRGGRQARKALRAAPLAMSGDSAGQALLTTACAQMGGSKQ